MTNESDNKQSIWSISSTSNYIISGSLDNSVKLWKIIEDELTLQRTLYTEHKFGITSVDISSDEKIICSVGLDNKLIIYNLENKSIVKQFDLEELTTYKCKLSPDNCQVAICGSKGKISLYSIEKQNLLFELKVPTEEFLMSISFSPCGNYLCCGSDQGTAYLMSLNTRSLFKKFNVSQTPLRAITFSNNGQYLAIGTDDGKITVYNPQHQNILGSLVGHTSWINSLSIHKDDVAGNLLVSGSSDTTIKFWCLDNMSCVGSIKSSYDEDSSFKNQVWSVIRFPISENSFKIIVALESGDLNLLEQPSFQMK